VTRGISKSNLECHLGVASILLDEVVSALFKGRKNFFLDILQLVENVFLLCVLDVSVTWNVDSLEFDAS